MEDVLVIRNENSLLFFNCVTLTVNHLVKLNVSIGGINQNIMLAEKESKDLVVYTRDKFK